MLYGLGGIQYGFMEKEKIMEDSIVFLSIPGLVTTIWSIGCGYYNQERNLIEHSTVFQFSWKCLILELGIPKLRVLGSREE